MWIVTVWPATAMGQTVTTLDCRPEIGIYGGAVSANGGLTAPDGYPDNLRGAAITGTFEWPLVDRWSLRADSGKSWWRLRGYDFTGLPVSSERLRVTHLAGSVVTQTRTPCGAPVRGYAGVGVGVYRFRFADRGRSITNGGVHAFAGLDVRTNDRISISGEVGADIARAPRLDNSYAYSTLMLRASLGVKVRF
jgi:hypothetical protein